MSSIRERLEENRCVDGLIEVELIPNSKLSVSIFVCATKSRFNLTLSQAEHLDRLLGVCDNLGVDTLGVLISLVQIHHCAAERGDKFCPCT